jgi:hypothetical protein
MNNRFSHHRPGKLDEQADKTGREAIAWCFRVFKLFSDFS